LFNPELYLQAYGKIYRNAGATTKGITDDTVDDMTLRKIHDIIDRLKNERFEWTPVRRVEIPKANGKTRPLGIPTWTDKLVQEVLRTILEAYYEPQFSERSHGFRPKRGCHSALRQIRDKWKGTVWFIEGDIKGCFDNIDHQVLLNIIQRNIHDGRLVNLIAKLLKAGYMNDWRYYDTLSGTPQGGIISPLLANIYMNELDNFVELTLIHAYTNGTTRKRNPEYMRLMVRRCKARKEDDGETATKCQKAMRTMPSMNLNDPEYRRLRYIRYADDFLLGFVGPKEEAESIKTQLADCLENKLKLTLSMEKTAITHAATGKANFLGYEITKSIADNIISEGGGRRTNGNIALLMPRKVIQKVQKRYSKEGKIIHRTELLADSDYTIIQRYQSVLRGIYNFYCMAPNVAKRMNFIKRNLEISLVKTLASKFKISVSQIYWKYKWFNPTLKLKVLQVSVWRAEKEPLIATFGGIHFNRITEGMGVTDTNVEGSWFSPGGKRSEVVQRLLAGKCELCEKDNVELHMHHIRKLADLNRPGRKPKATWEKIMIARKRKTLAVCKECHYDIHAGRYDGPRI